MYWQVFSESVRRSDRPARLIHNGNRWKLDRLSRSLRDGIDTLCDWLDKGVRLVSVTQQLDFAFPAGKMIASVLFAVAEMEQQTRRERQAAGIAVAKRNGVYQGRKAGSLKADAARALALRSKGLNDTEIATALGVAPEPCNATCTRRQGRADLAGRGRGRVIWAETRAQQSLCGRVALSTGKAPKLDTSPRHPQPVPIPDCLRNNSSPQHHPPSNDFE